MWNRTDLQIVVCRFGKRKFIFEGVFCLMNNIWSKHVQGIMTLYLSRKLRFDDFFANQYMQLFGLNKKAEMKILEIGCGPGALAEALHRWYPKAHIVAVDRDTNFITFAKKNIIGVNFIEGDATQLPFEDNSFDVVISNTVQEHIEPSVFWNEQRRVLKSGGVCLCLSARRGIHCTSSCVEMTDEEKDFWSSRPDWKEEMDKFNVCKYPMTEAEIPSSMSQHGFSEVTTGYAVIDLTPDDPKYAVSLAEQMIEAMRQNDIEAIEQNQTDDVTRIIESINKKYDNRIDLYRHGVKQWDTSVSITMVIRGIA